MSTDSARLTDEMNAAAGYQRPGADALGLWGHGVAELRGPDGELKQRVEFANLVTRVGDQYYGERAAPITSPPAAITGMQLGTGTTAVAKTGAGAAIVTLVAASLVAQTGTPASALNGANRQITYVTTWAAGTATATGISEVVLTNQAVVTQTVVPEANTMSRALLSPVVNKGASDSLTITWNHNLQGT